MINCLSSWMLRRSLRIFKLMPTPFYKFSFDTDKQAGSRSMIAHMSSVMKHKETLTATHQISYRLIWKDYTIYLEYDTWKICTQGYLNQRIWILDQNHPRPAKDLKYNTHLRIRCHHVQSRAHLFERRKSEKEFLPNFRAKLEAWQICPSKKIPELLSLLENTSSYWKCSHTNRIEDFDVCH